MPRPQAAASVEATIIRALGPRGVAVAGSGGGGELDVKGKERPWEGEPRARARARPRAPMGFGRRGPGI
jgi:hypothetical protein